MQRGVDAPKVSERNLLLNDRHVEAGNKVRVEEPVVGGGQADGPPDKLEVVVVLRVNTRCRGD
jgi:hypothetical protein